MVLSLQQPGFTGPGIKGWEWVRMAALTTTPSDPLAISLLPVPTTLYPASLEVLVPEGEMLPAGDMTMIPLTWKLSLPPGHVGLLIPLNRQAKKELQCWVLDPDHQGEPGLPFHSEHKEENVCSPGDPAGWLYIVPCPRSKVKGTQHAPNPGRTTAGPDPLGRRV